MTVSVKQIENGGIDVALQSASFESSRQLHGGSLWPCDYVDTCLVQSGQHEAALLRAEHKDRVVVFVVSHRHWANVELLRGGERGPPGRRRVLYFGGEPCSGIRHHNLE